MKKIILLSILATLVSCSNNLHNYSLKSVIEEMPKYDKRQISVKGYLKISEMHKKFLYLEPDSDQFLDLAFQMEILPRDQYIPETYYCVVVFGRFTNYRLDAGIIYMGSISPFGRIEVISIEHCEN